MLDREKVKPILILVMTAVAAAACIVRPNLVAMPAQAKPSYMDRYDKDQYAKRDLMGKCTVCHIGRGGGERNDFGEGFEDAGYRITPKLRRKFPQLFVQKLGEEAP